MKIFILIAFLLTSFTCLLYAQSNAVSKETRLTNFSGTYQNNIDTAEKFFIKKENDQLVLAVKNQGSVRLDLVSGMTYKPQRVQPAATIEFVEDSMGNINSFLWRQDLNMDWKKITGDETKGPGSLNQYAGKYRRNAYNTIDFTVEDEELILNNPTGGKIKLKAVSDNLFSLQTSDFKQLFHFVRNRKGDVMSLKVTRSGAINFVKVSEATGDHSYSTNFADRKNGFNRADTLRGMLTPFRTCYDVLFYDLDVTIAPDSRSVTGSVMLRFHTMEPFSKMQVDLYANMKIEKVLFHKLELVYSREFNAVFIQLPETLPKGTTEEMEIFYSGIPQPPDMSALSGGFIWGQDRNGKLWVESVCQGAGASLWWPCKDHLSDKPDSMRISITVPRGLEEISNGRLTAKSDLPGNLTRFDWYVSYPINTYNVVVNIGDYIHLTDTYARNGDTLKLNYYCLSYHTDKAMTIFNHVKPMLSLYERSFGPYPFPNDDFTLMESIYPMEHQGAVTFGSISNPVNSNKFDSTDVISTAWHETAHEWWGNNITCKDMADLWIHEAFATYSEVLNYETFYSKAAAMRYLKNQHPANKTPLIGTYNVNDFHLGDVYSKGVLMLHTLRNYIDDDSLWFSTLRNMQRDLQFQSVATEDIIGYFNKCTGKNLTAFFDQYLRFASIPQLSVTLKKEGSSLQLRYKWNTAVPAFEMPIKIMTSKNNFEFIYPNGSWQTITLNNIRAKDFKVDTDNFYISVDRIEL